MGELAVFAFAIGVAGWLALRPLLAPRLPWPHDPPDERDDVARAVSSLRDLEFATAAGAIAPADGARLRERLERSAFAAPPREARTPAPLRTIAGAALLAGLAAALVAVNLPREAGDRAPGTLLTGTVPAVVGIPELEAQAARTPEDIPTLLALAEGYRDAGRASEAVATYQRVLRLDSTSVPALNGVALILYQAGERDGAMLAVDRVLSLRPRDPDALFLKGLALYQSEDWQGAVDVWRIYLEAAEFHPGAPMVRSLYEEAMRKASE